MVLLELLIQENSYQFTSSYIQLSRISMPLLTFGFNYSCSCLYHGNILVCEYDGGEGGGGIEEGRGITISGIGPIFRV